LSARFARYRATPAYRKVAQATGVDPFERFHAKSQQEADSLYASGDLVSLTFWIPNLRRRQTQVQRDLMVIAQSNPARMIASGGFSGDDTMAFLCRPEDVGFWQSALCCDITNRVPWGKLRWLGGSRDDVDCRLPDRSIVDLDACAKWLNESVAAGWMVGVTLESDHPGHSVIVATRRKPGQMAQLGRSTE
jgi:hypothetical protein